MGGVSLARIQGMGKRMPLTSLGIVLCGLSLIGVPGTAGFISKWYLILAALEKGQWWLVFLIVLSSLLAVAYVWRFVEAAYFREPREDMAGVAEAPLVDAACLRCCSWPPPCISASTRSFTARARQRRRPAS